MVQMSLLNYPICYPINNFVTIIKMFVTIIKMYIPNPKLKKEYHTQGLKYDLEP